jgi:hypothetical protein
VTDSHDRFVADIGKYETAPKLGAYLKTLLGPESVESYLVLAYLLLPEDELFRAFVVTPDRFIVFEMLPTSEHLIVTLPLDRLSRIAEAGTASALTVTIEMDADVVRGTTEGEFIYALDAITPGEAQVTRGSTRDNSIIRPANYVITAVLTSDAEPDVLAEQQQKYNSLLEFSMALRTAIGR